MASITVIDDDGIAVVRIARPPANAMDPDLLAEGLRVAEELRAAEPDAVVLTGSGGFFSGGLDLNIIPTLSREGQAQLVNDVNRIFTAWYGFPRPVVTAVNGHAVAGGLILALCGDLRVGVPGAKLGLTEVKVGVPFPVAAMAIVRAEVPRRLLRTLVLGAGLVDTEVLHSAGVIDKLAGPDSVLDRAREIARELRVHPRRVYEIVKAQLRADALAEIEAGIEHDPTAEAWLGDDTAAAAAAVLERDG